MMKLFIDGKQADTDQTTAVSISLGIASITKIETGRTGYSKTIRVPMTARNRLLFGNPEEIHAAEQFNQQPHTARIEADGCTVLEGSPMMTRCESTPAGEGWYRINIIGAGKEWVQKAAAEMFNEIGIAFEHTITADMVKQSWTWDEPVRFFPVQRDRFAVASDTVQQGVRMLTFTDYHPFLNVRALVDAIAAAGGYTVASTFMDSAFFRALYISGRYPEKEVEPLAERMGFLAGRFADATAVADRFGRVYADPLTTISSVGNIVDTADPDDISDGVSVAGVYNRNGCFRKDGQRAAYYPTESVAVGFEYRLRYRSDYRIASRTALKCFDRVYLDDNIEHRYQVTNRNEDRRETYRDGWSYRLIVFDHAEANTYRFTHELATDGTTSIVKTFSSRSTLIEPQTGQTISNPRLWIQSGGTYLPFTGDWALYDGYVAETGQIDIELTVRSSTATASPSTPRYFHRFHFGGADEGMELTLGRETTLRPVFMPHPCEGTTIGFADVAAHEIRQIALINALKQLFNLYFYSDTLTRTLYVEPRETFYRNDVVVDWSEKIDRSRPVAVEEPGADLAQHFTLRYQPGDGSAARWDESHKEILGRWSAPILNRFAKEGEQIYSNPIFTPTLNKTGEYPDAPEASLAQVGDRDRSGNAEENENLNFPPKIVRYYGMTALDGHPWGWPSYDSQYPKIAFHDPQGEQPFTLCFEDRDGADGLHRYYDKTVELYNRGRRITLYLYLKPEDIEPLIVPNTLCHDFRALFRLTIAGETLLCRLEEICDYNPAGGQSTKCIFLKNV